MNSKSLKRKPKQQRSEATRAVIVEAAAQVLLERDYASSSTNRIAEQAGVSVGSIYQYFSNKEEIFEAVLNDLFSKLITQLDDAVMDQQMPIKELAEEIAFKVIELQKDGPVLLRKMRQVSSVFLDKKLELSKASVKEFIRMHIQQRNLSSAVDNMEFSLTIIVEAIEGVYLNADPALSSEQLAREIANLLTRYLLLE